MKLNCNKIIISAFKLQQNRFYSYLQDFKHLFTQNYPNLIAENIIQLTSEQNFTNQVLSDSKNVGVCFSSIGVAQGAALNRINGIRAAIVHNKYIAEMCRKHNDANVCVIGIQSIGIGLSTNIILSYLQGGFDNEERNMLRLGKIKDMQTSSHL